RTANRAGKLPQCLRHEPSLQAHVRLTHVSFELRLGDERGHRVYTNDVEGAAPHKRLGDLERLLPSIGLRYEELIDLDPAVLRVDGIERMLRIDQSGHAAGGLGLSNDVLEKGRLPRRFRAIDLDDAAARNTADAQRQVEGNG